MINPANTIAPTNVQSGNFADLPGVRLWYVDTGGAGTPVVLLHANTGTVEAWQFQIGVFAKAGWRVIAFDRRGWGKSTADPLTGAQPGTVAEDLDALADHFGNLEFSLFQIRHQGC